MFTELATQTAVSIFQKHRWSGICV